MAREAAKAKALERGDKRGGMDDDLDIDDEFGIVAGSFAPKAERKNKRNSNRPERQTKKNIGTWEEMEDEEAYANYGRQGQGQAWPSYGDYVKVFYAEGSGGEWYYGRVCDLKREAGIVVVQYDNGEVYEEDFPGENVDDFKIISYQEYKKHNSKSHKAVGGGGGGGG